MDQNDEVDKVKRHFDDYARMRRQDVARGLETPVLAAFVVEKYGEGMCATLNALGIRSDAFTMRDVDAAVQSIDPDWRENKQRRWRSTADLDFSRPRPAEKDSGPAA